MYIVILIIEERERESQYNRQNFGGVFWSFIRAVWEELIAEKKINNPQILVFFYMVAIFIPTEITKVHIYR